jgi:hypothetical protein
MTRTFAITWPGDAGVPRSTPSPSISGRDRLTSGSVPSESSRRGTCRPESIVLIARASLRYGRAEVATVEPLPCFGQGQEEHVFCLFDAAFSGEASFK